MAPTARTQADRLRILDAVARAGGVALTERLRSAGHSAYAIDQLVASGELTRIRRRWIALKDADPLPVAAARAGVVVSCVTRATAWGIWARDTSIAHVAAPPGGAAIDVAAGTIVHWHRPLVPRPPGTLLDSAENALALIAACQPEEDARAAVESAVRRGLVRRDDLLALPLPRTLRRYVEQASPWADSGLETIFIVRLRWMRLPIVPQAWIAGHHVDVLIGERLVVQIDGGHHVGRQRDADIAHDARLTLLGYHVIRVSYVQVMERWPVVQDLIMRAVAQGLHLAR